MGKITLFNHANDGSVEEYWMDGWWSWE